jgi:hypothetical protein
MVGVLDTVSNLVLKVGNDEGKLLHLLTGAVGHLLALAEIFVDNLGDDRCPLGSEVSASRALKLAHHLVKLGHEGVEVKRLGSIVRILSAIGDELTVKLCGLLVDGVVERRDKILIGELDVLGSVLESRTASKRGVPRRNKRVLMLPSASSTGRA